MSKARQVSAAPSSTQRPPERFRSKSADHPPSMRLYTIPQVEAEHKGLTGRLNTWVARADAGDPDFIWLKRCLVRVGRSRFIDDIRFRESLAERTSLPPAPSRRVVRATA